MAEKQLSDHHILKRLVCTGKQIRVLCREVYLPTAEFAYIGEHSSGFSHFSAGRSFLHVRPRLKGHYKSMMATYCFSPTDSLAAACSTEIFTVGRYYPIASGQHAVQTHLQSLQSYNA